MVKMNIKIDDDYYFSADDYSFNLFKVGVKKCKGYFTRMESLMKHYVKLKTNDSAPQGVEDMAKSIKMATDHVLRSNTAIVEALRDSDERISKMCKGFERSD